MTFTGWKTRINPATTFSFVIDPYVDARLTCVAVIDESSLSNQFIQNSWDNFRANWPLRRFVLFTPTIGSGPEFTSPGGAPTDLGSVWIPPNFDGNSYNVRRDNGNSNFVTDWFSLTGLTNPDVEVKVAMLYIDTSGSMTMDTVLESAKLFTKSMSDYDFRYKSVFDASESWINLFNISMNEFGNL